MNFLSVSGFWYSGSGAVYDYTRQFKGTFCMAPESIDETVFFNIGLATLANQSLSENDFTNLKFQLTGDDRANFDKPHFKRRALALYKLIGENNFNLLFEQIKESYFSGESPTSIITNFLYSIGLILSGSKSDPSLRPTTIVLNNDPNASNVEYINLINNAKSVSVMRDPRDQYFDICKHYKANYHPERFLNAYLGSIKGYLQSIETIIKTQPEKIKNFYLVNFEDFVLDNIQQESYRRFAELDSAIAENYFKPEVSQKNIGLYKQLDPVKCEYIDEKTRDARNKLAAVATKLRSAWC